MNQKLRGSVFLAILILLTLLLPTSVEATPPNCTCVEFVKAYFGITESVGSAKDMGTWLINHGFVQVGAPEVGVVAVMQPLFPGADTTYGHVGVIAGKTDLGTQWRITLKGANQYTGGSIFSEFGCSNVRNTVWPSYAKTNTKIKYYKATNYAIRSAVTRTGYANLYFDVSGGSTSAGTYINGWTYHGGKNQLFNFIRYGSEYRIIARNSAMCIQPQSTSRGARLIQRKCTGSSIEKWQWISSSTGYILKNSQTGYVADLNNGSLSPGNSILIWPSHNGINQRWWRTAK